MNERPVTRSDQIRQAIGTDDREYRITVTGTKRHTGKSVPLRRFSWHAGSGWGVDLDDLYERLGDEDDPGAVNKVLSAVQSQRHGRPTLGGTAWRIGDTDVPIGVLNIVLDALRGTGRNSIRIDDIKAILADLKVIEARANSSIAALRELILPGFPGDAEQRHARKIVHAEIIKRCSTIQ